MKRFLIILSVTVCFIISIHICILASTKDINGFRDFSWGASSQEVIDGLIEAAGDLVNNPFYTEDYVYRITQNEDHSEYYELTGVQIVSAGGLDATAYYTFCDDCLVSGSYRFKDYPEFEAIFNKYSTVYGEPDISIDDRAGWGECAIWVDEAGNIIILSEVQDVTYISANSTVIEDLELNEVYEKYHGFNLQKELGKINNYDGI